MPSDIVVRQQVLDHYGRKCACCDIATWLVIDHIDRQKLPGDCGTLTGYGLYQWIAQNGFPAGFQTLCRRCNSSKSNSAACRLVHTEGLIEKLIRPGQLGAAG